VVTQPVFRNLVIADNKKWPKSRGFNGAARDFPRCQLRATHRQHIGFADGRCRRWRNHDIRRQRVHIARLQIARFLVLHKELDADDDELTRTRKLRRGFIAEKYAPLVDALYSDKTEQYIETRVKFEDGRSGSISATLKILDAKTWPASSAAPTP